MMLLVTLLILFSLNLIRCNSLFDIIVHEPQLTLFTEQLEKLNLTQYFKDLEGVTLFAPVDNAFNTKEITKQQILYHVIRNVYTTKDLQDGMLLTTDADEPSSSQLVKVSKKKKDEIFIGNARIKDKHNIKAENGYLHFIDNVLSPSINLDGTIAIHPDLTDFSEKAIQSGASKDLRKCSHCTVFAIRGNTFGDPNDKLMDPLQRSYLDTSIAKKDVAHLIRYLIVPDIAQYLVDLKEGKTILKNVDRSEDLVLVKDHSGVTVNGVKVVEQDLLSSNGVIHILEGPLLPKNMDAFLKMNARKALAGMDYASRFVELFDQYQIGDYLDNENDVITLLAPPNDEIGDDLLPGNKMSSWLTYHIVQGYYAPENLKQHQLLLTKSHDDMGPERFQRIKVHINDPKSPLFNNPSIQFGKISVLGDPVRVNKNLIIYRIAHSLYLPREPLSRLPSNHELSTFAASLYASDSGETIRKAKGITLFAPTNDAFRRLGLVSKFLFQPNSKKKLEQVITYHAVHGLFYTDDITVGSHREPTLSGPEIHINKTSQGEIYLGTSDDREMMAKVEEEDMLTSNGVIHSIDRVQLPDTLKVTNRDLTAVEDLHSFLTLLSKTDLNDVLDNQNKPYTILAPNDRAFSRIDLEDILKHHDKLEDLVRLHVITDTFPSLSYDTMKTESDKKIGFIGTGFDTLLGTPVVISKNIRGGYAVGIGNSLQDAYITDYGRSSSGGGVLVIDRVLLPKDIQHHLPWWAIILIILGVLVGLTLLAVAGYYAYQRYQTREGQVALPPSA